MTRVRGVSGGGTTLVRRPPIHRTAYILFVDYPSSLGHRLLDIEKHAIIGFTLTETGKRARYPVKVASCGVTT